MQVRIPIVTAALALAALTFAVSAQAETLNLLCQVRESRADGAHRQLHRRLEIDLQSRIVRFYDDTGHGFVFRREYAFLSADAGRIRLESADGKESWVDRVTGDYYFHNSRGDLTIRGPCRKADAARAKF